MKVSYPDSQRSLLLEHLLRDIQAKADEGGGSTDGAFLDIAVRDLGFDPDDGFRVDGSGDYGFDHIDIGEREATIFQAKSVDFTATPHFDGKNSINPDKLGDLYRIKEVLSRLSDTPNGANSTLRKALDELRTQIVRAGNAASQAAEGATATKQEQDSHPFTIHVVLIAMGERLTAQAQQELKQLRETSALDFHDLSIAVRWRLVLLDDLLEERWRKDNIKWVDKEGRSRDKVRLTIVDNSALRPSGSFVFFTNAIDLVKSFEDFGYQIFDRNVRAEIHDSPVNEQIKGSVRSQRGRTEFRHLNNGITIIAESIRLVGPKDAPTAIELSKPGIVNGLQTVKSLHDSFRQLSDPDHQKHFEAACTVLCRVHGPNSVRDINQLIKATNNQNPMKPRNLRSNDPEQISYEHLFAELGWFYQRKEGSWQAFKDSPRSWPNLRGKTPRDFQSGKAERVVDNEVLAQNWLCFICFSREAINHKRAIFLPDHDPDLYKLCFLVQAAKHGHDYNYRIRECIDHSLKTSPSAAALLLAQLARELYEGLTQGPKEARLASMKRLGLEGESMSKEELETRLVTDDDYMTVRVMNGTKTLFVEFFGYIALRVWGTDIHSAAREILKRGAFGELARHHRIEPSRAVLEEKVYSVDDAMISIYQLYRHCIYRLVTDPSWRSQYDAAVVKSRFLYEDKSRQRLMKELLTLDELIGRRVLGEPWSDHFDDAKGVFKFLEGWLKTPSQAGFTKASQGTLSLGLQ